MEFYLFIKIWVNSINIIKVFAKRKTIETCWKKMILHKRRG